MTSTDRRVLFTALGLAAWWVLVIAPDASAYIDPSAGGMLVQLLLAGTAGAAVLVKLFWMRLRRLVGLPDQQNAEQTPARQAENDPI